MRTPRQFFRDLTRPAAPPPDEQPEDFFPHLFITPRAFADLRDASVKRGRQLCLLVTRLPSGTIWALATPYGNLRRDAMIRITCPEVPCYILQELREENAAYLVDDVPKVNDPMGTRTPGEMMTMQIPWPGGATASDPGMLRVSMAKLGLLHPELMIDTAPLSVMEPIALAADHLLFADANPTIVVSIRPELIVSAYSGDIDCVVLLRFPSQIADQLIAEHGLKPGQRLVSLNSYRDDPNIAPDLVPGPKYSNWTNYNPWIAEFLADDRERIAELHEQINEGFWQRCREMTVAAVKKRPLRPRDGRPLRSAKPAEL